MAEINFGLLTPQTGPTEYEQMQARTAQNQLVQQQLAQSRQATQLGAAQLQKLVEADQRVKQFAEKMRQTGGPEDWRGIAKAMFDSGDPEQIKRAQEMIEDHKASARLNQAFGLGEPEAPPAQAQQMQAPAAPVDQNVPSNDRLREYTAQIGNLENPEAKDMEWVLNAQRRAAAPAQTNNLAPAPAAPVNAMVEQTLPPVTVTAQRNPTLPSLEQGMLMMNSGSKREIEVGKRIVDYYEKQPDLLKYQAQQNRLMQMGLTAKDPEMRAIQDAINKVSSHAPAASTTVNVGQEKAFNQALGKGQGEKLMASKQAAEDARDILDTVTAGRNIMKSGMITGSGADFLVNLNQGLKTIGVDAGYSDAAANSQAYVATMAQNVGKLIKQFGAGTGLSDADRAYAEKMAGGNITLDKKAIEKILEINERAANNVIKRHNKSVQGVETNIPLTVELPTAATAAPATTAPPKGVDPVLWGHMTPEERKLWQK